MRAKCVHTIFFSFISLLLGCLFYVPSPFCLFTFISIQPIDNFFSSFPLSLWFWLTAVCFFMYFKFTSLSKSHTLTYTESENNGCTLHEERILIPFFVVLVLCIHSLFSAYGAAFMLIFLLFFLLSLTFWNHIFYITFSCNALSLSLSIAISIICHSQEKKE